MDGRLVCIAAAACAALAAPGATKAAVTILPAFTGSTECVNATVIDAAGPCTNGGASAFFSPSPFAAVQAMASGPAGSLGNGALAFLTYFYTIDGPDNGPVAVDIFTDLLASTSNSVNIAFASLIDTEGHQICAEIGQIGCNNVSSVNRGELVEMETPGVVYSIHMEAEASENGAFGGSAFASADPLIVVDASNANAGLYTIRLSDGVANALPGPGVPEPAGWALLLVGFGAIGGALRSRRRGMAAA